MTRILFVDDEPKILMALRRSLRSLRHQWEMVFAEGGVAGLEECASAAFDVVVSDARMPGMEGPEFLAEVARLYPDTVRMILSGQCSRNSVLRCVAVAHQFLSKPCDPTILKNALQRVCDARDQFRQSSYRPAISRIQQLPTEQGAYKQLVKNAKSPEVNTDTLAAVLVRDVGMTGRVMQLVSSGFFGSPQRVESPSAAAKSLGQEIIGALVKSTSFFELPGEERVEEGFHRLNEHSLAVASAAKQIAKSLTNDPVVIGDAYVSGMLHELGVFALAGKPIDLEKELLAGEISPEAFAFESLAKLDDEWQLDPGGYLAALWGLPDPVIQAISYHRVPDRCSGEALIPLIAVHVANAFLEPRCGAWNKSANHLNKDFLQQAGYADYLELWRSIREFGPREGVLQ
ncbi:MAG: HDOD domain-containing protein [bacterium]